MAQGDHVYVRRGRRYSHHGIDCGDGSVIHYVGTRASVRRVARTSLAEFAADAVVLTRPYERRLGPEETVSNAESRLGTEGYHLVRNNCEHFAAWCCTGRAASTQVRRWALGAQGALASVIAAQSMGAHAALLGTAGAGLYAMVRPARRRRRWQRAQVASESA
ncbi:hypothetical protein ASC77_25055 [Nocardioides sp. Root1257]|uniref:lecithin retinol acyltransferase family protein n=1 Tax=unclassified Nocardioides TaxID=2615069 RepID=UPI0006FFE6DD|nr:MULTISPECIES: lecithin retinol acyltransferase family protein [unclassified Nocardioides]KQW50930.1 hypothetical protein ASC77_25055 [Nocardioides sp. Root1257]KRC53726.1 hypothetical protein ASE24_24845 [Nocardioides sp. Root224]